MGFADWLNVPNQIKRLEAKIMATFQDLQDAIAAESAQRAAELAKEIEEATRPIAAQLEEVKAQLEQALANNQGAIDAAVAAVLEEQSASLESAIAAVKEIVPDEPVAEEIEGEGTIE